MAFDATTRTYGNRHNQVVPNTPFQRAAAVWDDRIGTARQQAFHWRLIALLSILATGVLAAGLVWTTAKREIKTYVVEIDRMGQPGRIELAGRYEPSHAQIGYFLSELVRWVRERPTDPVVLRNNWERVFHFVSGPAIATLNTAAEEDHAAADGNARERARTVAVSNVLPRSTDTYQVRWTETEYRQGRPAQTSHYTGLFEITLQPPRDDADVFRNPLGLYVRTCHWSRDFAPTERPTGNLQSMR